jgi:hypothetical protein
LETNTAQVEQDENQSHKGEFSWTSSLLFPVHTWSIMENFWHEAHYCLSHLLSVHLDCLTVSFICFSKGSSIVWSSLLLLSLCSNSVCYIERAHNELEIFT